MERYASAVNNDDFIIFNGSDEQFLGGRLMGANAGIGGTYGCMPELFVELDRLINNNEIEKAKSLQFKINECILIFSPASRFTAWQSRLCLFVLALSAATQEVRSCL